MFSSFTIPRHVKDVSESKNNTSSSTNTGKNNVDKSIKLGDKADKAEASRGRSEVVIEKSDKSTKLGDKAVQAKTSRRHKDTVKSDEGKKYKMMKDQTSSSEKKIALALKDIVPVKPAAKSKVKNRLELMKAVKEIRTVRHKGSESKFVDYKKTYEKRADGRPSQYHDKPAMRAQIETILGHKPAEDLNKGPTSILTHSVIPDLVRVLDEYADDDGDIDNLKGAEVQQLLDNLQYVQERLYGSLGNLTRYRDTWQVLRVSSEDKTVWKNQNNVIVDDETIGKILERVEDANKKLVTRLAPPGIGLDTESLGHRCGKKGKQSCPIVSLTVGNPGVAKAVTFLFPATEDKDGYSYQLEFRTPKKLEDFLFQKPPENLRELEAARVFIGCAVTDDSAKLKRLFGIPEDDKRKVLVLEAAVVTAALSNRYESRYTSLQFLLLSSQGYGIVKNPISRAGEIFKRVVTTNPAELSEVKNAALGYIWNDQNGPWGSVFAMMHAHYAEKVGLRLDDVAIRALKLAIRAEFLGCPVAEGQRVTYFNRDDPTIFLNDISVITNHTSEKTKKVRSEVLARRKAIFPKGEKFVLNPQRKADIVAKYLSDNTNICWSESEVNHEVPMEVSECVEVEEAVESLIDMEDSSLVKEFTEEQSLINSSPQVKAPIPAVVLAQPSAPPTVKPAEVKEKRLPTAPSYSVKSVIVRPKTSDQRDRDGRKEDGYGRRREKRSRSKSRKEDCREEKRRREAPEFEAQFYRREDSVRDRHMKTDDNCRRRNFDVGERRRVVPRESSRHRNDSRSHFLNHNFSDTRSSWQEFRDRNQDQGRESYYQTPRPSSSRDDRVYMFRHDSWRSEDRHPGYYPEESETPDTYEPPAEHREYNSSEHPAEDIDYGMYDQSYREPSTVSSETTFGTRSAGTQRRVEESMLESLKISGMTSEQQKRRERSIGNRSRYAEGNFREWGPSYLANQNHCRRLAGWIGWAVAENVYVRRTDEVRAMIGAQFERRPPPPFTTWIGYLDEELTKEDGARYVHPLGLPWMALAYGILRETVDEGGGRVLACPSLGKTTTRPPIGATSLNRLGFTRKDKWFASREGDFDAEAVRKAKQQRRVVKLMAKKKAAEEASKVQ